ncbi:hypothetical protein BX070DRAFT_187507 [Coemansia spiralis]|nr:hypothetical protein BX070DRAFT_187507 [Coemansia spiralis]
MPKEDYVAAEAKEPVTVKGVSPSGVPVVAKLRDAIPPFSSEPGHRTIVKPTGNLLGISIHPRIKEVGLRMAAMEIASSNARTIAALNAFIDFINDYNTPSDTVLNRNLTWHLSAQLNFLVYQRPMCIGMGNAIRWLKNEIAKTSASIQDGEAKIKLTSAIHDYIKERITAAGDVIAEAGAQKIQDGDVVLTYGASSTVQRLLIAARDMGRRFRVVVIDSRPENDGRKLVRELVEAGFSDLTVNNGITYAPITALSFIMREASKVFLGAEAFFANGSMLSRSGTAIVALAARSYHVPVIVSCETYKFSERIQLDAVVNNELGFPDTLMYKAGIPDAEPTLKHLNTQCSLSNWRSDRSLRLVNITQDVTPPEFVSVIITEVGMIPTTSIPVVLREYKNQI